MARHRVLIYVRETVNAPDRPIHRMIRAIRGAETELVDVATATEPTLYTTEGGGTTVSGPFTTDENGLVVHEDSDELWLPAPADLEATATKRGLTFLITYPGISAAEQGGREIGYAEITSDFVTSATHTTAQDVTGLTTTVTVGARPVIVEFGCYFASHSTTGFVQAAILEGATTITADQNKHGTANRGAGLYCRRRLAPSVGSHTYKVQFNALTVNAAATLFAAATAPAWLQVTEV